jgi:HEAT repeats/SEC-C motif
MTDYSAHSLNDLIDVITTWPVGMPVRAMERVLAMGESTVPSLIEVLERWRSDESRDLLWPVVLLGEIRSPIAVQPLIDQVQRTSEEELARAAAEGLAKIGVPSLPALGQLATEPDPFVRIYVYAALGGIRDDQAFTTLVDALTQDRSLGDVLAQALYDEGKAEAVPFLYNAYCNCESWQRIEFEDAIRGLHFGQIDPLLWSKNWRVRYRRDPAWGSFELGWLGICVLIREHAEKITKRVSPPARSLEEIIAAGGESIETCDECGAPVEQPTGLPVCPEIALEVVLQQSRFLGLMRQQGTDDIFDLCDTLDDMAWKHYESDEESSTASKQDRWQAEGEHLQIQKKTCSWLIEQGVESITEGRALLLAKAVELADRFGDPEGLLSPVKRNQRTAAKIGRNDPCPCGSGLKYKRCCLNKVAKGE